jgi:CheY-like chemotaxis protein
MVRSVTNPRRILLVDDSPEDRASARRSLKRLSQPPAVSEAETGELGLQRCIEIRPDCILLDHHLPDMSGLEALARMKNAEGVLDYPVVMITATGNEQIVVAAMRAGVQDYLVKGKFTAADLERAIENAIEKHALQEQVRLQQVALAEREAHYRAIFESTAAGMAVMDADNGVFVQVNDRFGQILGVTPDQLVEGV